MKKGVLAALAIATALLAAPAVQAQTTDPSGIYLGGSLGASQYKDSCKGLTIPCDNQDAAWRFFGGYQFNRNWAAEFGIGDFGEAVANGPIPAGGNGERKRHSYGFDLTAVGSVYITQRLSAFGRLGAYMARTSIDRQFENFPDSNSNDGKTNSGLTYGLGAGYTLGRFGVRLEWQRYDNVGPNSISSFEVSGTDEIDVFSLAFLFRFF
jgi:OmpA-OmpF porin, OOP family